MGLVRMDVDEVADIITSLRGVLETCFDEWSAVGKISSRALQSCDAMSSALSTHLPALSDLALDLQRRRDLAILLNSNGGSMPTGVLEYTAPGDDSSAAVTAALAKALADFARRDEATDDPEAMAALEAMLDRYSGQKEVLSAFYTELGPAGLLDVMASLSGPYAEFGSDEFDRRASLLAEIKSSFAVAERTWGDAATARYAKDLVDLASGTVNRPSAYPFGFGGALSYLLYDSNYSDAFLTSAATQIDHHERTTFGGYSSSGFSWTSGGGPNPWYAYFPENGQTGSYDLGVSLMSALGNNAEAGLDFFMEGNQDGQVTDRQMYWLHTREWEQDQFSHLSQALLAATTDPRLIQPWDSESACRPPLSQATRSTSSATATASTRACSTARTATPTPPATSPGSSTRTCTARTTARRTSAGPGTRAMQRRRWPCSTGRARSDRCRCSTRTPCRSSSCSHPVRMKEW
jgi:hypothetical protein